MFEWETKYSSNPAQDKVVVKLKGTRNPPICDFPQTTLLPTTYGVVHTTEPAAGGGVKHILRWQNLMCNAPCNMDFTVFSGVGSRSQASAWYTLSVPICSQ